MTVHDLHAASAMRAQGLFSPNSRPRRLRCSRRGPAASELNVALLAAECAARLQKAGIRVEQSSDFDLAMRHGQRRWTSRT